MHLTLQKGKWIYVPPRTMSKFTRFFIGKRIFVLETRYTVSELQWHVLFCIYKQENCHYDETTVEEVIPLDQPTSMGQWGQYIFPKGGNCHIATEVALRNDSYIFLIFIYGRNGISFIF